MKIIYFLEGTFNSGGIERVVIGKANWFASKGHDVTIVTTDQNGRPDFFPLEGVKRIDMDLMYRNHHKNVIKDYFRRRNLLKKESKFINKLVKDVQPDILMSTFGYDTHIIPNLKDKSIKLCEIHFQRWFRLKRNRKGVYRMIDKILSFQDLRNARKFDKFICLTQEDKKNWKGVKNINVVNNFIEPKTENPAKLENKSFIAVGRLAPEKGFDRVINSWALVVKKHPEWILNIYGDGILKEQLQKQIKNLELEKNVILHPPTKNIHKKYLESSGLVMTSYYEGLPMVMLEAMEVGLPIVTFDFQCGPKDIVENGVNGYIVKNGDTEALANSIIKLIENPLLRKKMGAKSFELAKKYYKEPIMKKWEELLELK